MKCFELELDCSRGTLAIGGYSPTQAGVAAVYAQDEQGRPLVPATALRGALRLTLEALLRGAGVENPCEGGAGQGGEGVTCRPGQPCSACQIFGGAGERVGSGQRAFASLVLGDATLCDRDEAMVESLRHGVAVARAPRAAAEEQLWAHLGPAPGQPLRFRARGRILRLYDDPARSARQLAEHAHFLQAAVRMTQHIGAGRSRGLGRVELSLRFVDSPEVHSATPEVGDEVRLRVLLLSPASVGLPMPRDSLRETRLDIPGAALRGAVGFGLAEVLTDPSERSFQQLVHDEDGALFDFLYPVDPEREGGPTRIGPWPRTTRSCKRYPYRGPDQPGHGLSDVLCDLLAIELAHAQGRRINNNRDRCPVCQASLEPLAGWRGLSREPATRVVQRVRINRHHGGAQDQALFSHELIEAGQWFEGSIRRIPAAGRAHLARALHHLPLSLGRGRHRGWGRVQVTVQPAVKPPPLSERRKVFLATLRRRLEALGVTADGLERIVVLSLLSPLLLEKGADGRATDDGCAALARALGGAGPVTWLHVSRRFGYERGWSQRTSDEEGGVKAAYHCALAGSVYVACLPDADGLAQIERLEQEGIGPQRRLGFGRVLAFDPIFAEHAPTQQEGPGHGH